MPAVPKLRRQDLKPGDCLCNHCTAKCCRYFALPMETPTTWQDFDYLRWYLLHGRVSVFVEGETWYLVVHTECRHLGSDNLCGIYETRPAICRAYSTVDCEYDDDAVYDKYFETPEQICEYAEAILPRRRGRERFQSVVATPSTFPTDPTPAVFPVLHQIGGATPGNGNSCGSCGGASAATGISATKVRATAPRERAPRRRLSRNDVRRPRRS